MKNIFKRIKMVLTAILVVTAAAPITPINISSVMAAECVYTATEIGNSSGEIKLCGYITGNVHIKNKAVTIDLNGKTLDGDIKVTGSEKVIIIDSTGGGKVTGVLDPNQDDHLIIQGGSYLDDPSLFVNTDDYEIGRDGSYYVVKKKDVKEIIINDITMSQEDTATVGITTVPANFPGVAYEVTSSPAGIAASISGSNLTVSTGDSGVVAPGEYTVTVGVVGKSITKNVKVTVTELFTDFTLEKTELKENEELTLAVKTAQTMGSISDVTVSGVTVTSDLVEANGVKLVGKKAGEGTATASVTATYKSNKGNTYTKTKNFDITVISALESIKVKDKYEKGYGTDAGEIAELEIDEDEEKDFEIEICAADAGVDYLVSSENTNTLITPSSILDGKFKISGKLVGTSLITATVTAKGGLANPTQFTKIFNVKVNPVLKNVYIKDGTEVVNGEIKIFYEESQKDYTVTYDNASVANVEYRVENSDTTNTIQATIDNSGKLTINTGNVGADVVEAEIEVFVKDKRTGTEKSAKMTVRVKPTLLWVDSYMYIKEGNIANIKTEFGNQNVAPAIEYELLEGGDYIDITKDGEITAKKPGIARVKTTASYDGKTVYDEYGMVFVYKVAADKSDTEEIAREALDKLLDEALEAYMELDIDKINAVKIRMEEIFGSSGMATTPWNLLDAMQNGQTLTTYIKVEKVVTPDAKIKADIEKEFKKIGIAANIEYYDVRVIVKQNDGTELGDLHQLDQPATIAIVETTAPAAGFTRKYYVVRYHDGKAELLKENKDYMVKNGKIYIISDEFSVFGVAYEDTLIPKSPDTGFNTKTTEGNKASNNLIVMSAMPVALMIVSMFALVAIAKRKK